VKTKNQKKKELKKKGFTKGRKGDFAFVRSFQQFWVLGRFFRK
jgi:hypothetical protein